MSYWNYRVIKIKHQEKNTPSFEIHEVYYNDSHEIEGWTESPIEAYGESFSELEKVI